MKRPIQQPNSMKTIKNFVLLLVAILCYAVAYNVTNVDSTISANILPKHTLAIKVFGERNNGCLTLVRVTTDEKVTTIPAPYPVYRTRWLTPKVNPYFDELVDMPIVEPLPFNGITPLVVPDMADINLLSEELAI